jgi:hypothetical protein
MNILNFKKTISSIVMVAYTTLAMIVPMGQAQAAPICKASDPTTAAGGTPGCAVKLFPSGPYAYAKFNWTQVAEVSHSPSSGINLTMASGERVVVSNNRTAAALGLQSNQVADVMSMFPTSVPFVLARYNPQSFELRIDVFKVETVGNKKVMLQAPFTPAHGGAYAASMNYATASDKALGQNPGANPFALYNKDGEDAFYNVGSLSGVQVAVGHAMRMAGASVGLVSVAKVRVHQYQTKSGKWYKKTITTHVEGWTKPDWFVVTPPQFQPRGEASAICAIEVANASDCPQHLYVQSGVVWTQWEGGTLPAFEDMTSHISESKSSFTLIAWVVVIFAVVFTAGAAAVAAGATAGTAFTPAMFVQSLFAAPAASATGALTMSSVLATAAMEAGVLALSGTVGGAKLNDPIKGTPYFGATSAMSAPTIPEDKWGRSIYDGVQANFDNKPLDNMGVRAVTQGAYGAGCAAGAASTACADSGVVPRPDTGVAGNNVQFWQDNGKPLVTGSPFVN